MKAASLASLLALCLFTTQAFAQGLTVPKKPATPHAAPKAAEPYYTARTMFTGGGNCLEITSNGINSWVRMAGCVMGATRQQWRVEALPEGGGPDKYARVHARVGKAEMCLQVVDDGSNGLDKGFNGASNLALTAAACGSVPAAREQWKIEASENVGYSRLRNPLSGSAKCLDVVNDRDSGGKNDQLNMAECGNFSGQYWRLTRGN